MNILTCSVELQTVSAGCHINDVMNANQLKHCLMKVSAGCHINDVMN